MPSKPIPPTKKSTCNRSRQDPRDPERSKHQTPQPISLTTVKKQMIHRLPITPAHDAAINKVQPSTPQIITCKDPIPYSSPHKEGNTPRNLNLLDAFSRKNNGQWTSQLIVKRSDIKSPILCQLPSHTITIHRGR